MWLRKKERYTFFLLVGHTYLNCRAVTQHQGPCGPGSPTWGRRGSGDKHLSGRFSTNVMLHGNHTCCASKTGQTGFGGPERKRTVVTVVRSPHSANDDEVEEEEKKTSSRAGITISSVHEKNSWILSSYSQFPIAVPPSSFPALICIPRGTSSTSCLLVKHSRNRFLKNSQER